MKGGESRLDQVARMGASAPGSTVPQPEIAAVERRKATRPPLRARPPKPAKARKGWAHGSGDHEVRLSALRSLGFEGALASRKPPAQAARPRSPLPGKSQEEIMPRNSPRNLPRHSHSVAKVEAIAPDQAQPAAAPPDLDELRRSLVRKLAIFTSDWRRCTRRVCRRGRQCVPPDLTCLSPRQPARVTTPEEDARAMAYLKRELDRRLAAINSEAKRGTT
jgi:hypothetical protein